MQSNIHALRTTMKLFLILAVRCCLTLLDAAPLQTQPLTRATSLANKLLSDIPAGLGLSGAAEHLEYWLSDLGIPAPPVLKSEGLSMDVRLSRIVAGLELHRGLLQDLRQLSSSTEELSLLLADITDLSAQVQQLAQIPSTVSQKAAFPTLSPRLSVDQVQVAIHLSLQQLRSFTQDVLRSLRHIAASN